MHDRALDYARCTQALREDRERPGFAGIFDEALTNALAAIVAARWPGTEMRGSRVKSASELLDVIEEHGEETEVGVFELSDPHGPQGQELFGRRIGPVRTTVRVGVFREGVAITQPQRHARLQVALLLGDEHVAALMELNDASSLRAPFAEFDLEQYEQRVALADSVERARARTYIETLGSEEWARREAVDYEADYTEIEDDERYAPHECPVCGLRSLIETRVDSYLGEIAAGTCVACSYVKTYDVADLEGRDEALDRAIADPRR